MVGNSNSCWRRETVNCDATKQKRLFADFKFVSHILNEESISHFLLTSAEFADITKMRNLLPASLCEGNFSEDWCPLTS